MPVQKRKCSHPALSEFASIAEALCGAIANDAARTPEAQLRAIHELLPRAYGAALQLPSTSVLFDDDDESPAEPQVDPAPEAARPELDDLAEFLGMRRFYREIFDPYEAPSNGECMGDIIDDLSDIHHDVATGLAEWREGKSGEALWQWRFNFEHHWGEHATSALRALYALSAWRDVPWPSGTD